MLEREHQAVYIERKRKKVEETLQFYSTTCLSINIDVLSTNGIDSPADKPSHRHIGLKCYAVVNWCISFSLIRL